MEDVTISESNPSSSFADVRGICLVCQKQFAKYTCPKCNTRYCSLQCYKGHNLHCTESFMRENVSEEMQQIQPEDETRRKTLDILKRFHLEEEEMDAEDDSGLSEETLQKVLSGDEIRLEDLSTEELKKFQRAIASGELSKLIELWTPWWTKPSARSICLSPEGSQLINLLEEHEGTDVGEIPLGPSNALPPLKNLTHGQPSPLLAVHLVDVLYAYCFTLRLYNGDWHCDPFGAANVALNVSKVMGDDRRPETVAEALGACLEETCSARYRHTGGSTFSIGIIGDVIGLLSLGSGSLICLLCDFQRLFQAAEKILKSEKVGKKERSETFRRLKSTDRKVYFLMCWVHEQPEEAWSSLAGIVEVEKASLSLLNRSSRTIKAEKGRPQSKVLIKEV